MIKTNKKLQGRYSRRVLQKRVVDSTDKTLLWDPSESVATRPLMFKLIPQGLNLFYAFDGNKNVSDVFYFALTNGVGAHYDYAPLGAITRTSKSTSAPADIINENPIRFSSEFRDSELGLVYYNYRHYSPLDGRFLSRDPVEEQGGLNLYAFVRNKIFDRIDIRGEEVAGHKIDGGLSEKCKMSFFEKAINVLPRIIEEKKDDYIKTQLEEDIKIVKVSVANFLSLKYGNGEKITLLLTEQNKTTGKDGLNFSIKGMVSGSPFVSVFGQGYSVMGQLQYETNFNEGHLNEGVKIVESDGACVGIEATLSYHIREEFEIFLGYEYNNKIEGWSITGRDEHRFTFGIKIPCF